MKQKTAMQKLIECLNSQNGIDISRLSLTDKALAEEKEQIMDAFSEGFYIGSSGEYSNGHEEFYNKTYNQD